MRTKILLGLFFFVSIIYAQIPTANQERAYTFDNSSLADATGSNDFTQNGTNLVFTQDRLGNATSSAQLNGAYLTSSTFSFSDFSIAFWIKTSTNDANERTIFDKSERTQATFSTARQTENGFYIYLKNGRIGVKSGRRVVANNNTGATTNYLGDRFFSEVIADGTWKHIVITIDKQATQFNTASGRNTYPYEYNFYVDGQLEQTSTENVQVGGIFTGRDLSRPVNFSVGNMNSGILSSTVVYQDEIDDVYVYTSALTATDVSQFQIQHNRTLTTTATNGTIAADIAPTNGTYSDGTVVQLTATPTTGYQFDGWSGDASGITNPLSVTMDSDKNITALFSQIERTLTLNSTNGAIQASGLPNSTSGNSQTRNDGEVVTLTALPDTNYQFNGWSGDVTATTNPVNVTMDADKTITANFGLVQHTLTTTASNGTVSVDIAPTNGTYDYGTVIALTATPVSGYQFDGWSGDASGTTNPLSVTIDADKNITAIFSPIQRALVLTATNGFISVDISATNNIYDNGTEVELTATPDTGYQFDGWSGDITGTINPLSVTMDADKNITAMFSLIPVERTLTIFLPRDGSGVVTRDIQPINGRYNDGTVVELTAVPATGYQFAGWSGYLTGNTNPVSITMDADKTVTANFSLMQQTLTTTAVNGTISVDIAPINGTYDNGTVIELTATPDAGYQFDGWSGDANGSVNPLSTTMDANKTITAMFSLMATASIADESFNNIVAVYPNPVISTLKIDLTIGQKLKKVQVFNLVGEKIIESIHSTLDFTAFSPGIYVLKVENSEGKIAIRKVVKK